jgi:hypothetical protein
MLEKLITRWKELQENPFWVMEHRKRARQGLWAGKLRGRLMQGSFVLLPLGLGALGDGCDHYATVLLAVALAHLQILFLACRATASTASSVVNERQRGTLLTIALTKLNSADYADGVALCSAARFLTDFSVWLPVSVILSVALGGGPLPALGLWLIGVLVILLSCYSGIQISATSKTAQAANQRAFSKPLFTLCGLALLFPLGGFIALPLWLAHPFGALDLAIFGFSSPAGGVEHILFWKGWVAAFALIYSFSIADVRRRAINALERARLL